MEVKRSSRFKDPVDGLTCPGTCEQFILSNAVMLLLINTPEPQPVLLLGVSLFVWV